MPPPLERPPMCVAEPVCEGGRRGGWAEEGAPPPPPPPEALEPASEKRSESPPLDLHVQARDFPGSEIDGSSILD